MTNVIDYMLPVEPEVVMSQEDLDLLTVQEAAKILKCSTSTVWRATSDGSLRCMRFGRVLRVRRVDLAAFVREHVQ
jgi:excisionase family DNA binding protein